MALVTANGAPVLRTSIVTPRTGAWHADLYVDQSTALAGRVAVVVGDGDMVLLGTVAPGRSGVFLDVNQLRVVAGNGGLGLTARPRRYRQASLRIVLADLLADAGEVMDATADPAVLSAPVADWTTRAVPVGAAVAELLAGYGPAGTAWRMLAAGTFWVGFETWPDSGVDADPDALLDDNDDETRTVKLLLDQPRPLVGTTALGAHVSLAQFTVDPTGPVVAQLWFEPEAGAGVVDRMKAALLAIVRGTPPGLDGRLRFWARLVGQSGTRVHAVPTDTGLPDMGEVELAMPPGDTVEGASGGRVLVGFAGRDRSAVAHGFQGATPASRTLAVTGTLNLGGPGGQSAVNGEALVTYLQALAAAIPGPPPDPTTLLAKKTKVT